MINVRFNMFETNSSSVHALVIPKEQSVIIPKHVILRTGEYGWENAEYGDTLSYLYTACKYEKRSELPKLLNFLKSLDIEVEEDDDGGWAYVDHGNEIPFEELFGNEELLKRFLFGTDSYIKTGNDNENNEEDYPQENDKIDILWKYN